MSSVHRIKRVHVEAGAREHPQSARILNKLKSLPVEEVRPSEEGRQGAGSSNMERRPSGCSLFRGSS